MADVDLMKGYVKFTGDYSRLKELGYGFQKLYAANYQQWNKGPVRVWRKGTDVTFDTLQDHHFSQLIDQMKAYRGKLPFEPSRMFKDTAFLQCYLNTVTGELTLDKARYWEWFSLIADGRATDDPSFHWGLWENRAFTPESLADVKELYDLGWLEVSTATAEAC
jgi:hypothetical protein